MSTLYLMRHGQTLFNQLRRKQGACDSPLTELGIEQARQAGEWLAASAPAFDRYYTSTQERASDTLEIAVPGVPYERVKGIKEQSFGKFEGITEDLNLAGPAGDFYAAFGGEADDVFAQRVLNAFTELMERPGSERVLAVTHGCVCAQMLRLSGYDLDAHGKQLGNCAICIFEFDPAARSFTPLDVINPL